MAVKSIDIIKSYLTEGKYPTASELVDVIDTLVSICQNSDGSISYNHLELVPDLDAYTDAPVGEIVKYTGQTNNKYTRGWDYEKVSDGGSVVEPYTINLPAGKGYITNNIGSKEGPFYPTGNALHRILYYKNDKTTHVGISPTKSQNPGDTVFIVTQTGAASTPFTINGTTTVVSYDNTVTFSDGTSTTSSSKGVDPDLYEFVNTKGESVYIYSLNPLNSAGTTNKQVYTPVYVNYEFDIPIQMAVTETSVSVTIGGESVHWQPILRPTASNNS